MRYAKFMLVMAAAVLLLGMGSCDREEDSGAITQADLLGLWKVDLGSKRIEDKTLGMHRIWLTVMPLRYIRFTEQQVIGYTGLPSGGDRGYDGDMALKPEQYDYALEGEVLLVRVLGVWQSWGAVSLRGRTMTLENGKEAVQAQCLKQELGDVAAKGAVAIVRGTNTMRLARVDELD